jgi:hypothetical protein
MFNQSWVVVSNHCEKQAYSKQVDYYGGSQIVDPCGKVVAHLGDEEGLVFHKADLQAEITRARTLSFWGNNFLQDRKPEHYGALVDVTHRHPGMSRGGTAAHLGESGPGGLGDPPANVRGSDEVG